MADDKLQRLQTGLIAADKAGDVDAARVFASEIRKLQSVEPAKERSFLENVKEGAKLGITDLGNRIAQLGTAGAQSGMGAAEAHLSGMEMPSADYPEYKAALDKQILENRQNPVLQTGGGKVGYIGAKAAPAVAATFVPGGQTLAGSAAIGAASGLMEPTIEDESTLKNAAYGAAGGAVGYAGGQLIGKAADTSKKALARALMQPKQETFEAARSAGYVVNPSAVNPSFLNKTLESFGGKAAIGQEAASRNQQVTTSLAKKALGVPDDVPLTNDVLAAIRTEASAPYQEIASLSKKAANNLEKLKQARNDANVYFNHYNRSADPSSLAKARAARETANSLEASLEKEAERAGREYLIPALREARQEIAKTYTVGRALTPNGEVNASVLGAMLRKGQPLTGELKDIAKFQQAFPSLAREGAKVPTSGVSKLDALISAGGGSLGYAIDEKRGATLGVLAPFIIPPSARGAALSKIMQNRLQYPGLTDSRMLQMLSNPYARALLQGGAIQAAPIDQRQQQGGF